MRRMCIHISAWQIIDLERLSSGIFTLWGGWCSIQRWHWLWSPLPTLVGWRHSCSLSSPLCLLIVCGAIVARKGYSSVVLRKYSQVSFDSSLVHCTPRELNTLVLLFTDIQSWFLDLILCFRYCGAWKPSSGHCGHINSEVHVGLLQLYPKSLLGQSSRDVENLQESSCCF